MTGPALLAGVAIEAGLEFRLGYTLTGAFSRPSLAISAIVSSSHTRGSLIPNRRKAISCQSRNSSFTTTRTARQRPILPSAHRRSARTHRESFLTMNRRNFGLSSQRDSREREQNRVFLSPMQNRAVGLRDSVKSRLYDAVIKFTLNR